MVQSAHPGYPRGWFIIGFSDEFPQTGTKSMTYFGQRLVAFRGEDGQVHVLDAYCAHMGADLGAGGKVVGNHIECPFHAWKYCGKSGDCVEIPYAKKIPAKAKQKVWRVREVNGVVLLHFDPHGREPTFDVPVIPDVGSAEWLPWTQNQYVIRTHPREIVENLADKAHFPRVHDTEIEEFSFEVEGHLSRQRVKGFAKLPGGGVDRFASMTEYHGPGYLIMRMDGVLQNWMLVGHTPIDEHTLVLRMGVMLKIVGGNREKTQGYVGLYMTNLKAGFEDDIKIWENKLWRDQPVLCDGDGPIAQLRRWYKQFYTAPQPAGEAPGESTHAQA